ncbi:cupin domain-containing protein [Salegentibacter sp. LM13S]|uniref:cupin domain-containing protein n=1 Tax=Salegentibacter lacus TaxID=2873599 RepID=UPI001CCEFA61|nr:cupin domain-containing protein [Salegentibacter lacus]MBZ9632460.1 cupin domain-containing protein [Salegentibacter lacus]
MKKASLTENLDYKENSPAVKVLFETEASKEIRMAFKAGQGLKEHKTSFPIVVEVFEGAIDFGVQGEIQALKKGDLIALEGNVPHDLKAKENSIVRLSLTKADTAERVENVAKNSM